MVGLKWSSWTGRGGCCTFGDRNRSTANRRDRFPPAGRSPTAPAGPGLRPFLWAGLRRLRAAQL